MIRHTGIGTYLRNLLPRLITRCAGWRFRLLGDPDLLTRELGVSGGTVEIVPFRAPIYGVAEQLWWLSHAPRADVLWIPHYNIPLHYRGRLAVTVHDLAHLVLPEHASRPLRKLYARSLFGAVRRRADAIVFVSRFTAQEFRTRVGAPRGETRIISEGVDPLWYAPRDPWPHPRPYMAFVGNLKPNKNIGRLLAAFDLIAGRVPHDLVIVGRRDGFLPDRATQTILDRLKGRLHFTGHLDDDLLVRRIVGSADLLVVPSFYEGFGLPVLEAMASGCAVLAARATALPEVGGDAVAYCDPFSPDDIAAQLGTLLLQPELRQRLAEAGRRQARRFDWDPAAEETAALLAAAGGHAPGQDLSSFGRNTRNRRHTDSAEETPTPAQ